MDKTRSRIILYTLAGAASLAVPLLFSNGARTNLLLPSLAPALIAMVLLARICLTQLDAAHSLSTQLGEMIERRDTRHLFVPTPDAPEMNAVGHRLNVLIYTMAVADSNPIRPDSSRPPHNIDPMAVPDAA